jgi:hypothetical protein
VVFSKLIVDPYLEYRSILKEISHTLIFHAGLIISRPFPQRNDLAWPPFDYEKAVEDHVSVSKKVRDLSARLRACVTPTLRVLWLVRPAKDLNDAAGRLIRISNCMLEPKKKFDLLYEDVKAVGKLLNIDVASG